MNNPRNGPRRPWFKADLYNAPGLLKATRIYSSLFDSVRSREIGLDRCRPYFAYTVSSGVSLALVDSRICYQMNLSWGIISGGNLVFPDG
ncbi:hypothetical protein CEXT_81901 [Caerostris extrusa]|uniref:Uncharacterized protein n=1 Tax=Caerostris extrusa TaxID=172846 RepID=A0AAV4NK28_CAEEX|nr:hypothetical protein CEXT_81901 [Caerostris extrusa]